MSERAAVVLCNLGGPDSLESVRPFLFNLFSDPDIFRLPLGFLTQRPFASLVAWRRAPSAAKGYAAIGGKSPILEFTNAQAAALAPDHISAYNLTFEEGIEHDLVFSVDLASEDIDAAADTLAILHRESIRKGLHEDLWNRKSALSPQSIGRALFTEPP